MERRLGRGHSDANRKYDQKEAAAKRFIKFLKSLDEFHSGEITSIFEIMEPLLDEQTRPTAHRVKSELTKMLA